MRLASCHPGTFKQYSWHCAWLHATLALQTLLLALRSASCHPGTFKQYSYKGVPRCHDHQCASSSRQLLHARICLPYTFDMHACIAHMHITLKHPYTHTRTHTLTHTHIHTHTCAHTHTQEEEAAARASPRPLSAVSLSPSSLNGTGSASLLRRSREHLQLRLLSANGSSPRSIRTANASSTSGLSPSGHASMAAQSRASPRFQNVRSSSASAAHMHSMGGVGERWRGSGRRSGMVWLWA